jgi:hypothetical protein
LGDGKCRKYFVGEIKGNRPLGRPKYRWDDNIKINLKKQPGRV